MKNIFLLAERVVTHLKIKLVENKEFVGYYSFKECKIHNSSLEISFTSKESTIKCVLSTHPLDMPWNLKLIVDNRELDQVYEVYPNLLKAPQTLGNELANKLSDDVIEYLKINITE